VILDLLESPDSRVTNSAMPTHKKKQRIYLKIPQDGYFTARDLEYIKCK